MPVEEEPEQRVVAVARNFCAALIGIVNCPERAQRCGCGGGSALGGCCFGAMKSLPFLYPGEKSGIATKQGMPQSLCTAWALPLAADNFVQCVEVG